jgi:hypothetical protein
MIRTLGIATIWLLTIAAQARAAEPARNLGALGTLVGQLVYVQNGNGQETLARVVRSSDEEIVVTVAGTEQAIPARLISKIFVRGDSLQNGVWWGGALGFRNGVLSTQGSPCSKCPGRETAQVLMSTGLGIAIGTWIDAKHVGRTEVYRGP